MRAFLRFMLLSLVCLSVTACTAEDEVKQGVSGEYCNDSDLDCRPNHVCDRGTCRLRVIEGYNCESMCQKIESCNAQTQDCLNTCLATIDGNCPADNPCPWSDAAVESFGRCIVDELVCIEIIEQDAPQICYEQIPLPQSRRDICENFTAASQICEPSADVTNLRQRCYSLARTGTEASWQRVFECTARINDGFCAEIADCLNQVFLLNPALDLGDGQIDFNAEL